MTPFLISQLESQIESAVPDISDYVEDGVI